VRTRTIHRTVRIVRHERVHHRRKPAPAAPATLVSAPVPAATAAPPPRQVRPLVTRTSGGRGHGDDEHEREHEGGDD
jgi:hypothetical protein